MSTENTEEAYDWAKKQREEWDSMATSHPMVSRLDSELSGGGDHPVATISFTKFACPSYTAEVGKNDDGDLIFHFWPTANDEYNHLEQQVTPQGREPEPRDFLWKHNSGFDSHLADSFIEVFKFEDRLCWDYVPELNSWVVRAQGFGGNLMADELSSRLFESLRGRLEK